MNELNLDPEEKELIVSYEADEWLSVGDVEAAKQTYREYARATFKKGEVPPSGGR